MTTKEKVFALVLVIVSLFFSGGKADFDESFLQSFATDEKSDGYGYTDFIDQGASNWMFLTAPGFYTYNYESTELKTTCEVLFGIGGGINGGYRIGLPILMIHMKSNMEFEPAKAIFDIGEMSYSLSLEPQEYISSDNIGNNELAMVVLLGYTGIDFYNSLASTNFTYTARVYSKNGQYFDFSQPPEKREESAFYLFYNALVAANYLYSDGRPSAQTQEYLLDLDQHTGYMSKGQSVIESLPVATPYFKYSEGDNLDQYESISVGYKGDVVKEIRERLFKLGYVTKKSNSKVFTKDMVKPINEFQKIHNIEVSNKISPELQDIIFSNLAIPKPTPTPKPTKTPKPTSTPFIEPNNPIKVVNYSSGKSYGTPWFELEISNKSKTRTVDGFTLTYYCTDVYGEKLRAHGFGDYDQYEIVNKTIKPGKSASTNKISVYGYDIAKRMHIAISKIHCTDGTTITLEDRDLIYWIVEY